MRCIRAGLVLVLEQSFSLGLAFELLLFMVRFAVSFDARLEFKLGLKSDLKLG